MLEENIIKIIELRHDAPYLVLGPHYDSREQALLIRAFLPQAESAYVLLADGTSKRAMQRLHPGGLFEFRLPGVTHLDYQLMTLNAAGQAATFRDPYAIHDPSFSRTDSQAFSRGALESLFTKLGAHPRLKEDVIGVNFTLWAPHASRVSVV